MTKRKIITLSKFLRLELGKLAKERDCSEAEVLRTGLILQLKEKQP